MDRHSLWIKNDAVKRRRLLKFELKRLLLKSLKTNKYSHFSSRESAAFRLIRLAKDTSKSSVKNRCIISGRSYALDKKIKVSRFIFRKEAYSSNIPGLKRASW
jgi:small subunit ribosomal protein S14